MHLIEKAGTNVRSNHFDCAGKRKSLRKSSEFKGVRMRKWGKWVSEIRVPRSRDRIWLGSYDTPEKAARAYDAALYCLRGAQGGFNFNFPAGKRPQIHSELSVDEIKAIAARFAMLDSSRSEVSEDMGECSWSSSTVSTETSSPEILFSGLLEDLPKMSDSAAGGFEFGGFSLESLLVEDPDLPELDGFWDL